jgi:hypothetical protein
MGQWWRHSRELLTAAGVLGVAGGFELARAAMGGQMTTLVAKEDVSNYM